MTCECGCSTVIVRPVEDSPTGMTAKCPNCNKTATRSGADRTDSELQLREWMSTVTKKA